MNEDFQQQYNKSLETSHTIKFTTTMDNIYSEQQQSQSAQPVTRDELAQLFQAFLINNNTNNHSIRVPTPPKYDGQRLASAIDNWFITVERYLQFHSFTTSRWVEFAITLLEHDVMRWYNRITQGVYNYFTTWDSLKQALELEFKPRYSTRAIRDRLADLKQVTSIHAYTTEFQNIL